jgi:hypothetical protein
VEQRRGRADGVSDQRDPARVDVGAGGQPAQTRGDVLGEARHRREILVVALAVTARVEQQHRHARAEQRRHHRPHRRCVRAPAVHDEHGGHRSGVRLVGPCDPGGQPPPARAVQPDPLDASALRRPVMQRRVVRGARRAQAAQDRMVEQGARAPPGRDEGERDAGGEPGGRGRHRLRLTMRCPGSSGGGSRQHAPQKLTVRFASKPE